MTSTSSLTLRQNSTNYIPKFEFRKISNKRLHKNTFSNKRLLKINILRMDLNLQGNNVGLLSIVVITDRPVTRFFITSVYTSKWKVSFSHNT